MVALEDQAEEAVAVLEALLRDLQVIVVVTHRLKDMLVEQDIQVALSLAGVEVVHLVLVPRV